MFNLTTQAWSVVNSAVKMPVVRSGCSILPNEEILIVGSWEATFKRSAYSYNVKTNVYTQLSSTTYDQVCYGRRFWTKLLGLFGKQNFSLIF